MDSQPSAQDDSLQDVPALIDSGKYPSALRILVKYKHPLIGEMYPNWKANTNTALGNDNLMTPDQIQKLHNYAQNHYTTTLLTSTFLVITGGLAIFISLIGLAKIVQPGVVADSFPVVYCCGIVPGLPVFLLGVHGYWTSRSPDWYSEDTNNQTIDDDQNTINSD